MRTRQLNNEGSLAVLAVAGTYVITLGMNLKASLHSELLGFSIQRTDHNTNRTDWLTSFKVFEDVLPDKPVDRMVSTEQHPIQDFFWSDFTVRPGRSYTYRILARGGTPAALTTLAETSVTVTTETTDTGQQHEVYFNRGVAGSQAFVNKFGDGPFSAIATEHPEVWPWLSRGLQEAMFSFIQQATDAGFGIRASVYEFSYEPVLTELAKARSRGADVQIIVHAKADDSAEASQLARMQALVKQTGLENITTFRKNQGDISHNKFLILLKGTQPIAVWTGSTNLSVGGIFGHSNVGHIVRSQKVTQKYLSYWKSLHSDPVIKEARADTLQITSDPVMGTLPAANSVDVFFSPRPHVTVLDWYANVVETQAKPSFITVPFGLDKRFEKILAEPQRTNLIFVISDKPDVGLNTPEITANPANRTAFGSSITRPNSLESWMKKERLTGLNSRVQFIHTKYILVDPLGDDPITITGSANFSVNSIQRNDENTLVIRGNTRVADVYFGEFMRLFRHFYFRDVENSVTTASDPARIFLNPTPIWAEDFFTNGTYSENVRLYFSGSTGDI
ncbi:phospholipase D-like domain-containing protein [Spirosoma sp. KNUC1025]|uniref:phospholipase D-like domain-containing protein n=1 Tax=Spirosoma sp. KNUC1025 TaxID=2894082 RepID=UPI003870A724|nr:phospholipase D-like domain-containing protein [Spirosoma sp. KNUC1025]